MSITLHAELEELTKLGTISDSKDAACDPVSVADPPSANSPQEQRYAEIAKMIEDEMYVCQSCGVLNTNGEPCSYCKAEAVNAEAIEIADALIEGTPVGEEIIDFSKPILHTTGQQVSDCCGAYDRDMGDNDSSFSDFGFCPECRDHCEYVDEEEDV